MFENLHSDPIICAEGWLGHAKKEVDVLLYYHDIDTYCLATFFGVSLLFE